MRKLEDRLKAFTVSSLRSRASSSRLRVGSASAVLCPKMAVAISVQSVHRINS